MDVVEDKETIESLKRELEYLKSKNDQMMLMLRRSSSETPTPVQEVSPAPQEVDLNSNDVLTKNVGACGGGVRRRSTCEVCFLTTCALAIRARGRMCARVTR